MPGKSAARADMDERKASAPAPTTATNFIEDSARLDPIPDHPPGPGCAPPVPAATRIAGLGMLYCGVWQICQTNESAKDCLILSFLQKVMRPCSLNTSGLERCPLGLIWPYRRRSSTSFSRVFPKSVWP